MADLEHSSHQSVFLSFVVLPDLVSERVSEMVLERVSEMEMVSEMVLERVSEMVSEGISEGVSQWMAPSAISEIHYQSQHSIM